MLRQQSGEKAPTQLERRAASAARLSLIFNFLQTTLKFVGALLTGSISLLSEALHSASDVLSSLVSFVSIRAAAAPPDEEHPYGHGKIDTLAGLSEAILLFLFAIYTLVTATIHIFQKPEVTKVDLGLWILVICMIGAVFVSFSNHKAARETESFALQSNVQHLNVDIITTVGVLVSLLITKFTGWQYADPIFAIGLSLWLGFSSLKMVHSAFHEVIDRTIDEAEIAKIKEILEAESDLISYHKLRTRHSGAWHYIDIHLVVPRTWSVVQGHELADRVEKKIEAELHPAVCTIHIDPSPESI
jgi:cation diffusion facilitator family transporter